MSSIDKETAYWLEQSKKTCPHRIGNNKLNTYQLTKHIVNNALIDHYDNSDKINWSKLPSKIVLKSNQGASANRVFCLKYSTNKDKYYDAIHRRWWSKNQLMRALKPKYGPILIEKFLTASDQGLIPWDFKFYIFYDELLFLRVYDRNQKPVKIAVFDYLLKNKDDSRPVQIPHYNWYVSDYHNTEPWPKKFKWPSQIQKAEEKALEIGKFLKIPFVRVDMYLLDDGQIILGELTFMPGILLSHITQQHYLLLIQKYIQRKINLLELMH